MQKSKMDAETSFRESLPSLSEAFVTNNGRDMVVLAIDMDWQRSARISYLPSPVTFCVKTVCKSGKNWCWTIPTNCIFLLSDMRVCLRVIFLMMWSASVECVSNE